MLFNFKQFKPSISARTSPKIDLPLDGIAKKYYRISSCNGKLPSSKQSPQTSNFPRTVFSDRQQTHDPARSSYQTPNFPTTVFSDRQQTHDPAHSKLPNAQLSQDSFVRPTANTRLSTQQLPTPSFPRIVFSDRQQTHDPVQSSPAPTPPAIQPSSVPAQLRNQVQKGNPKPKNAVREPSGM